MPLRNILHKKDKINDSGSQYPPDGPSNAVPEIKFIRSDTISHEVIDPSSFGGDVSEHKGDHGQSDLLEPSRPSSSTHRRSLNIFSRSRSPSESSEPASPSRRAGNTGYRNCCIAIGAHGVLARAQSISRPIFHRSRTIKSTSKKGKHNGRSARRFWRNKARFLDRRQHRFVLRRIGLRRIVPEERGQGVPVIVRSMIQKAT